MSIHYRDYRWKEGIPYGIEKCSPSGVTYKIPMDPYRKRISVEAYRDGAFERLIYDSHLLNFRHLKPEVMLAWEQTNTGTCTEIRDQDDRLLCIETYTFDGELCRECRITSPHGILIGTHKMHYKALGDTFNGVILFDANDRPVLSKTYEVDEESGQYTELKSESLDLAGI